MKLRDLYPYWSAVHDELIEKLELLNDDQWSKKKGQYEGRTIKQIVVHLIDCEKFWIGHIAKGQMYESILSSSFSTSDQIVAEFQAVRASTVHYIESLSPESLRQVRTAPADPAINEIERNVPLSWIIWNIVEHEIYHWGQIVQRLND